MQYVVLTDKEEMIGKLVVDSAYVVHKQLGPGLLESVYETCFCHELNKRGVIARRQVPAPINYDGIVFDMAFRLDVLVEDLVVCELKAVDVMHPVYDAQLLSHLKMTGKRLGFLINFNVPMIKQGIKRMIQSP